MVYNLYCDGAVTKNPGGEASYGYVLRDDTQEISYGYGIIGSSAEMNNVMAECYAISQGLADFIRRWDQPDSRLNIYNDSKFVISQLNNRKNKEKFFSLIDFQIEQLKSFVDVHLVWVPRDGNVLADTLAKRLREINLNYQKYTQV